MEECPYITPCGWCSRQGKPCEIEEKKYKKKQEIHNDNPMKATDRARRGGVKDECEPN